MNKVKVALIGAGRGINYMEYALLHPHELEVVAVAEPNQRREQFKARYGLEDSACFENWNDFFAGPKLADAVLICTQDKRFRADDSGAGGRLPCAGKPMSPDPEECIRMGEMASQAGLVFSICHVAIYAVFTTLKELLERETIGQLMSIQHNENVGYWHQAHSFVRGIGVVRKIPAL